jgi:LPPG:FO 2-phospho-L-lactate transferase
MIVVLAGGVGAARFLEGLVQVAAPEDIAAIVNTGDDSVMHGLRISPDLDIVTCTLAGVIDRNQGWGMADDTVECMTWLGKLGGPTWYKLGDRDLALHIRRTELLHAGQTLTQVADQIRRALGVAVQILPMSDDRFETHIQIPGGLIHFEEYLVRNRAKDPVLGFAFVGGETAQPTPEVLAAIRDAEAILIAPSNPIVSVGTILALPGVRAALAATNAPVVAVSPIVGGAAIKGPAAPMLEASGYEVSALGVARCYQGLIDAMVIDSVDAGFAEPIQALGIQVAITNTIMRGPDEKRELAQATLDLARQLLAH